MKEVAWKTWDVFSYHLVRPADKDGDSTAISTIFDDKHLIARRAKGNFAYNARLTKFFRCEFLESGHDAAMGSYSNQLREALRLRYQLDVKVYYLDLRSTNPPHSG